MATFIADPFQSWVDGESRFQATPGTNFTDVNGREWLSFKAGAAIAAGDVCDLDEDFEANSLTKALADAGEGHTFCAAQVAVAAGAYGWGSDSWAGRHQGRGELCG